MTPKQAITLAKSWADDIVAEEGVAQIDLEEIRYDDAKGQWLITVGFYRVTPEANHGGPTIWTFVSPRRMQDCLARMSRIFARSMRCEPQAPSGLNNPTRMSETV